MHYITGSFNKCNAHLFRRDSVPRHTSKSMKQWLKDSVMNYISDWPVIQKKICEASSSDDSLARIPAVFPRLKQPLGSSEEFGRIGSFSAERVHNEEREAHLVEGCECFK